MRWLKWTALAAVLLLGTWQSAMWNFYRSSLPAGQGIWWRVYGNNDEWGFGPGGNETGFNEFLLPARATERIAAGGETYMASLAPIVRARGWDGDWMPTPVPAEPPWVIGSGDAAFGREPGTVSILAFLGRYGFLIDIPEAQRARIDAALTAPGSYYAFGRGGRVIVLSPGERRAWVAYSG